MRIFYFVAVFILFLNFSSFSTEKVLTSFNIDAIDAGGVYSRANIGINYSGNVFYVFYPAFYSPAFGQNIQRIKAHKMTLQTDGSIKGNEQTDLNDICFPATCAYFQNKIFLIGQANQDIKGTLVYKTFDGSNWSVAQKLPNNISTYVDLALFELNAKLYLLYKYTDGSIRMTISADGTNWSEYKEIKSAWLDANHGSISACIFSDNDNKPKIFYTFTNKDNSIIFCEILNENGDRVRGNQIDVAVNNVSCVQGSSQNGRNGNIIQIFYSNQDNNHNIKKIEYSISEDNFSAPEELDFGISGAKFFGNTSDYISGTLYAFQQINQDTNQKYIINYIARFYNNSQNEYLRDIRFYTWKSDFFKRDKNYLQEGDEMTDYEPVPALCKLVGVIEGPPPYTANGYDFNEWGKIGYFPPSALEYGTTATSSTESTTSIKTDLNVNANIWNICGGFQYSAEDITTESISKVISQNISIEPTKEVGYGYRIFLKPIIQRKKYFLFDWDNKYLNLSYYLFKFFGPFVVYEPYKLSENPEGIVPQDIYTYLNRKRNFNAYSSKIDLDFEWSIGSSQTDVFSFENTIEHSSSSATSINVGFDAEFGEIFKVNIDYGYEINYQINSISSFTTDFALKFYCPGDVNDSTHIKYFAGKMFWLLPTKNMDSWWLPNDFVKDSAWLITYDLSDISNDVGGNSVNYNTSEEIFQVFPNPSNTNFEILVNLPNATKADIFISDILGNVVKEIKDISLIEGKKRIIWNTNEIADNYINSGIYFINLRANNINYTKKISLIK